MHVLIYTSTVTKLFTYYLQDSQQSVTSVVFQGENMLISSGAVDGNIKIWDLRKIYSSMRQKPTPCHMFPYPGSGMRKHGESWNQKSFPNCFAS